MIRDIADIRRDYEGGILDESRVPANPFELFEEWFSLAVDTDPDDANAMTLSTVDSQGLPHARIVLLKGIAEQGFEFYTNYHSGKGGELANVPHVALVFWWPKLSRQIRIEGDVEMVSEEASDAYFASRPRGSQLGAWISNQSVIIPDRAWLEERKHRFEQVYEGQEIPRPVHWGGYRVLPEMIEFWQGQPSRLHDRIRYQKRDESWETSRLAP
uniref:pyridoxamine 5'-phosphate oxidase n=1 Tax=Halomonas sp. TaxID=1486246 RepID=UPI002611143F|nr:pyridoxamine 5'-phosphate oxidase [Halomonas sp.]